MSPEELGAVALSMTFVTFTTQVIMGGLQAGIGRYFSIAKKSKELDAYFLAVKKIMLTVVFFIFSSTSGSRVLYETRLLKFMLNFA